MRGTIAKHYDIGLHFLGGNGIGRYGTAGLADVVARPDGVVVPVRNYQMLGTAGMAFPKVGCLRQRWRRI